MTRTRAALALLLVLAVVASGCSLLGGGGYTVSAHFSRTFNLFPGSTVRVLGVEVGKVHNVTVSPDQSTATVDLVIDDGVKLPANVNAHIIQGALLGERIVELEPAYTSGPTLKDGATIPVDRTTVPAEFDEVLESLNNFLEDLPPDEMQRLIHNAAGTIDGLGTKMGKTLDATSGAVSALRDSSKDLVTLSGRLADLNETLATRDQQIGTLIEDWQSLVQVLSNERGKLDDALTQTARMTTQLKGVLDDHATALESDIESLTRFGRTLDRNISQIDLLLEGQSELYRAAKRVFNMDKNWLPLVNHSSSLGDVLSDRMQKRLAGLCERLGLDQCANPDFWKGTVPDQLCMPPLIPCDGAPSPPELPSEPPTEIPTEITSELPSAIPTGLPLSPGDGTSGSGGGGLLGVPSVGGIGRALPAAAPSEDGQAPNTHVATVSEVLAAAIARVPELGPALEQVARERHLVEQGLSPRMRRVIR